MSRRFDPRMYGDDGRSGPAGMVYLLMLVVALAFGGFLWQLYDAPATPQIAASAGPYKVAPPPERAQARAEPLPEDVDAGQAIAAAPPAAAEPAPRTPRPAASGPYVAQLAALRSQAAVQQAWRRLEQRAPDLFADARLDVVRADLGARGVYFRVRAGYFPDRANASQFCERIRQLGQDCIAAAR